MFKVVVINAVIFFALVGFTEFALPLGSAAREAVKSSLSRSDDDTRASLPNYQGVEWAEKHFAEFQALRASYRSYVGWQRDPIAGETITVFGPYSERRTVHGSPEGSDARPGQSVYFFGGSTMWGTGANDENTISSLYSQNSGNEGRSFGESGWRPRQSINRLIDLYESGHRPDFVVFYNGVNHIGHCNMAENIVQHSREQQISTRMQGADKGEGFGLQQIMQTHKAYLRSLTQSLQSRTSVAEAAPVDARPRNGCEHDPERASAVARSLIEEWKIAKILTEAHGGTFVAILQPVAILSQTPLDHLVLPADYGYAAVYPLVRERIADIPWAYDLSDALDTEEYVYIDCCHLSPAGNDRVARRIDEIITVLTSKTSVRHCHNGGI